MNAITSVIRSVAVLGVTALICGCTMEVHHHHETVVTATAPAQNTPEAPLECCDQPMPSRFGRAIDTDLLASGQAQLKTTSSPALESFLQDLNRRKDHAIACMNGGASNDSIFLWYWIEQVCAELQHRGYHFDAAGDLYQGQRFVALR